MAPEALKNYINGEWQESAAADHFEVRNPATGEIIAMCPDSPEEEVRRGVEAAREAFWGWRTTLPTQRANYLYNLRQAVIAAQEELAETIVREHGKTIGEARGELTRSLQYIEHPIGIPELLKGDYSEDVGTGGVDEFYIREPLGVFVVIPPFNFPAMISLYFTWPVACGNTVVIKPSELCPMTMVKLAELAEQSGFPPGVINVVQGGGRVGHQLVTDADVAGVTFIGSSPVARKVYEAATSHGKRAQCQGGAKNHALMMEDANLDQFMDNLITSCFANASQRCFAVSNILVHKPLYEEFKTRFVAAARQIKLGYGMDPGVTMGPVVSKQSLEKLLAFIEEAEKGGASILLDGRNPQVDGYPDGYFLGPTILEAEPGMRVFDEEVFGPVRCLKAVEGMDEAVEIINSNSFGHSAVIYTSNGGMAREFTRLTNVGQVGINVGTPAPIAFYPVGGRRTAFYGPLRGRGKDAIDFYTDKKVVVSRWPNL
jgi:malonate-semialdehyde dehydrogenase (acetylating)/methylmalonate-semialdehyde dehydrogenase